MLFTSLSSFSQDVTMTLFQNSIKLQNDSLYLRYRIQNNTDTLFALYRLYTIFIELDWGEDDQNNEYSSSRPGISAFVKDENDELLNSMTCIMEGYRPPREWDPNPEPEPVEIYRPVFRKENFTIEPRGYLDIDDVILFKEFSKGVATTIYHLKNSLINSN